MKYPDILSIETEPLTSTYTAHETILYALGVGMGADPLDPRELSFVYEKNLRAVPTMGVINRQGFGQDFSVRVA